ncbi:MAG: hypothetical protein ISR64_03580 [Deltaproteobacteria bacterium]|nr:hypothetical protein [Deltaproteobacteria bacterium]
MEIDEPEAFAEILNLMWETDILNNIINVLFVVDDVIKGEGGVAFERLSVTLGPGWRNPWASKRLLSRRWSHQLSLDSNIPRPDNPFAFDL